MTARASSTGVTVAIKAEYIWIDGTEPTARLRSKTKVLDGKADLPNLPIWGFDGSSTNQAPGKASDLSLIHITDPTTLRRISA
jgi:hypothetical protein